MSTYETNTAGAGGESLAAQTQEKVQQTAQQATSVATRYIREQTETRGQQVAQELQNVAGALRRSSHALHADGNTAAARSIEQVTDRLQAVGGYLGSTQGDRMLRDLEAFGRRRPWGMIGLGLGLGVAASRFLKASSSRRYDETIGSPSAAPSTRVPVRVRPDEHVTGEIPVVASRGV
jgi:hypothetical protein